MSLYASYGWYPVSTTQPHVPSTGLVAIYENGNVPEHAALVTISGVFAKMGHLGTYQFSNVNQMAGGGFGQPALWLAKKSALPTIQLFPPQSGTYNGQPFAATALVAGTSGPGGPNLEGVAVTLRYYAGNTGSGPGLAGAPVNVGTYTVVATFAGSTNYISASQSATFTISPVAPSINVKTTGGPVTRKAHAASATIAGVNGQYISSLEGVTPTVTYHAGASAGGRLLAGPPIKAGTYTVVTSFAGSNDYAAASTSTTFTVGKVKPVIIKRKEKRPTKTRR
jgi:hypothetical protein